MTAVLYSVSLWSCRPRSEVGSMATTPRSLRTPLHIMRDASADLFSPGSTLRSTIEPDAHEQQPPQIFSPQQRK